MPVKAFHAQTTFCEHSVAVRTRRLLQDPKSLPSVSDAFEELELEEMQKTRLEAQHQREETQQYQHTIPHLLALPSSASTAM
mmetsp:Transcript_36101/g.50343  ORF Transcript_36101/g.50343 Transcript_36101/m.50343 type:complete len:82 (-) Transcript_36101:163-408(-)